MGDVVYTSHVRVERIKGPLRRAELPHAEIEFGVHDEIADHFGVPRGSDVGAGDDARLPHGSRRWLTGR